MLKRTIVWSALCLGLLFSVWYFYMRPIRSVIYFGVPDGYQLVVGSDQEDEVATLTLTEGIHTLHFKRAGRDYAAVIRVSGGGEIYGGIEEADIHPVTVVKYQGGG
jgi:hypothetical protein